MSAAEIRIITITEDDLRRIIREELAARAPTPAQRVEEATGYLSVPAAAKHAACSEETIRAWIHNGRLPQKRVGRHYRVARADLDRVLSEEPGRPTAVDLQRKKEQIVRSLRGR